MNAGAPAAALTVEGLTIRFGGLTAVDGVSFEVREREVLSLIGPNGAGKTTAFNAITGYIEPAGGEIRYGGARLTGLGPTRLPCVLVIAEAPPGRRLDDVLGEGPLTPRAGDEDRHPGGLRGRGAGGRRRRAAADHARPRVGERRQRDPDPLDGRSLLNRA